MYARVHVLYLLLQYLHVCMPGNSCMFARDLIEKCHTLQYGFGLLCAAFGKISLFKKTVLSCIHTHTHLLYGHVLQIYACIFHSNRHILHV